MIKMPEIENMNQGRNELENCAADDENDNPGGEGDGEHPVKREAPGDPPQEAKNTDRSCERSRKDEQDKHYRRAYPEGPLEGNAGRDNIKREKKRGKPKGMNHMKTTFQITFNYHTRI